MNLKQAKFLRFKAQAFMNLYVMDKVLTEEQVVEWMGRGEKMHNLYKVLPYRTHFVKERTRYNGLYTQRWWVRMLKKYPDAEYNDIMEMAT